MAESLNKSQLRPHVLAVLWKWATSRPQPWRNPELWSLGRMKREDLLRETRHSWGPGPRWTQAIIFTSSGSCSRRLVTYRLQLLPALEAGRVRGRHWQVCCLLSTCFLVHRGYLLIVSSPEEGAGSSRVCCQDTDPILRASPHDLITPKGPISWHHPLGGDGGWLGINILVLYIHACTC